MPVTYILRKISNIKTRFKNIAFKAERFFLAKKKEKDQVRVAGLLQKQGVIKLHIGCGARVLKGWVNIDMRYEPYEQYLKYFTDVFYPEEMRGGENDFFALNVVKEGLPFPDNSVDVIFHEDFIEHLTQKEQVGFLAEALRVLKKGGVHRVNTPDLLFSMRSRSHFDLGLKGVYNNEWDRHQHFNVLTEVVLKELALMVGYSEVFISSRDKSISGAIPREYRPDPSDRPTEGNLFADLVK